MPDVKKFKKGPGTTVGNTQSIAGKKNVDNNGTEPQQNSARRMIGSLRSTVSSWKDKLFGKQDVTPAAVHETPEEPKIDTTQSLKSSTAPVTQYIMPRALREPQPKGKPPVPLVPPLLPPHLAVAQPQPKDQTQPLEPPKENQQKPPPFRIPAKHITFLGPLKMKKRFRGDFSHDYENDNSPQKKFSGEIEFAPDLNEAVAIGKGIEEYEDTPDDSNRDDASISTAANGEYLANLNLADFGIKIADESVFISPSVIAKQKKGGKDKEESKNTRKSDRRM